MGSQYKDSDTKCLTEAYSRVVLGEAGMWDRVKARGAQARGALAGVGDRVAGTVRGAVAGAKGDTAGFDCTEKCRRYSR